MIQEYDRIVLTVDLPEKKLKKGDVGTVVMIFPLAQLSASAPTGYEVEFFTLDGKTFTVETLLPSHIRPVRTNELAHVREVA